MGTPYFEGLLAMRRSRIDAVRRMPEAAQVKVVFGAGTVEKMLVPAGDMRLSTFLGRLMLDAEPKDGSYEDDLRRGELLTLGDTLAGKLLSDLRRKEIQEMEDRGRRELLRDLQGCRVSTISAWFLGVFASLGMYLLLTFILG